VSAVKLAHSCGIRYVLWNESVNLLCGTRCAHHMLLLFLHSILQRKDFDDFLNDRVSTIRVWRSMGGNITKELNNYYCLRGLEPYQSPSLNTEMHSHRCMHHKAILREQRRQRRAGVTDPDRIQAQVSHMSAWALQRAQRLGAVDARDVLSSQDSSSCVSQQRRFSSAAHFQTSNVGNSGGGSNTVANSNMPRRTSMPTAVFSQQQHQSVNVDQLKAWNVNLLERMAKEQAVAACVKSTPTMVDELGLGGDVKSTTNFPTMSLRELLKAPHPLMHSKRAPDFLTFSSSGEEAMKRLPYQVIRRDSLSCHGA